MKISDMMSSINAQQISPLEEMKNYIVSLARELRLDEGHVLPTNVLLHKTINLNPKQRDALEPAINSLIDDGFFEERDGKAFLTGKGKDLLY